MPLSRCIIYTKDICRITGKSERYARTILYSIRKEHGKQKHHLISLAEFCNYTGLNPEEVSRYLS